MSQPSRSKSWNDVSVSIDSHVPWRIEITRTAEKQIAKLGHAGQRSIQRFLRERLASTENPREFGKPLRGEKQGLWRYRVGDYRLICHLQDERITVLVLEVGHRKDIYR